MKNAKYYVSYAVTLICQGDKAYAKYLDEKDDNDKLSDNENFKKSQKKYKKAKEYLEGLNNDFNIIVSFEILKSYIKKARDKGIKEYSEIQDYVKKKLKDDGVKL